jgi:hypothetical protein
MNLIIELALRYSLLSLTNREPIVDPKQAYYESCIRSAEKLLSSRYPQADPKKTLSVAKENCDRMMTKIYQADGWAKIKDPVFDGCVDAIKVNLGTVEISSVSGYEKRICGKSEE